MSPDGEGPCLGARRHGNSIGSLEFQTHQAPVQHPNHPWTFRVFGWFIEGNILSSYKRIIVNQGSPWTNQDFMVHDDCWVLDNHCSAWCLSNQPKQCGTRQVCAVWSGMRHPVMLALKAPKPGGDLNHRRVCPQCSKVVLLFFLGGRLPLTCNFVTQWGYGKNRTSLLKLDDGIVCYHKKRQ